MSPKPEYAQHIIVGVLFRSIFSWYITEYEYWYLDYTKYKRALLATGYTGFIPADYPDRFHIAILNEDTAEYFLSHIESNRISASMLSQMMLDQKRLYQEQGLFDSLEYFNARLDFSPCFFVDFDQRQFFSQYPEMIRFENYVPESWIGAYKNFLSEIPEGEKYWIVDGNNLFEHHVREK